MSRAYLLSDQDLQSLISTMSSMRLAHAFPQSYLLLDLAVEVAQYRKIHGKLGCEWLETTPRSEVKP